ncbi:unnamed protein product [Paramecium sonneborni]|uniref:Uncharacterized protein n=1 Tax=Paramecium sonneborni TaxID=65129 RepID=A0A8S1Q3F3_9CILI|nr:unnamed protein product [Paramecium sonneborni]
MPQESIEIQMDEYILQIKKPLHLHLNNLSQNINNPCLDKPYLKIKSNLNISRKMQHVRLKMNKLKQMYKTLSNNASHKLKLKRKFNKIEISKIIQIKFNYTQKIFVIQVKQNLLKNQIIHKFISFNTNQIIQIANKRKLNHKTNYQLRTRNKRQLNQ